MVQIGECVTFVNRTGQPLPALVTQVWGQTGDPAINVVIVSQDGDKGDRYGRQIERETSIPHKSSQSAPGYYWMTD